MDLLQTMREHLPTLDLRPLPELEAEIHEELEFHLEMRFLDNMAAGMSPDDARRNARQRFGDFEQNRQACRKITLGARIMLSRIQAILLVVLLGAVIHLGMRFYQMQAANERQLKTLTDTIERLQAAQIRSTTPVATIPYRQWDLATDGVGTAKRIGTQEAAAASNVPWDVTDYSPNEPWSN